MVVSNLLGSCKAVSTTFFFSLDLAFSAISFNLSLLIDVKAVSEPEKRPDNKSMNNSNTICQIRVLLLKGSGST